MVRAAGRAARERNLKMQKTYQTEVWTGDFGQAYLERSSCDDVAARRHALAPILAACSKAPQSILEVGSNIGKNLLALSGLTDASLHAVEPFKEAHERLLEIPNLTSAINCDGQNLPYDDGSIDLVFTSGVLIHVGSDDLQKVMSEIVRVSGRYIWCNEYFAKTPETIPYRGEPDLLFKRDFGRLYIEKFPALRPLATGFLWSAITPYDDTTWWLLEKTYGN